MKTIIAGSRDITDYAVVEQAANSASWEITEVISGGARGVDTLGERYAKEHGLPCRVFKADWNTYGKQAGAIRNVEMARVAEALVAVWDGVSPGTLHMINVAYSMNLQVYVMKLVGDVEAC